MHSVSGILDELQALQAGNLALRGCKHSSHVIHCVQGRAHQLCLGTTNAAVRNAALQVLAGLASRWLHILECVLICSSPCIGNGAIELV